MDEIILNGIRLKGKHGCFAKELEQSRDFAVSMKLFLSLSRASKTDALEDTIDYPCAIAIAEGVVAGESVRLIEKLADKIAERMFARFGLLREIEVKVQKFTPELAWELSEISVIIKRKREEYL